MHLSGAVFLYFDGYYSLILAGNIIIYSSLYMANFLKYVAVTAQFL